jgi:metallo-beta-lactamase family protein
MAKRITRRQFVTRAALATAGLAMQPWRSLWAEGTGPGIVTSASAPSLKFCGAAQFVSGSQHLLDTGRWKILLDCGVFMEPENDKLNGAFSFDPKEIDVVILSHAHADHTGNLHHLIRQGFRGKVICTDATRDIFEVVSESLTNIGLGANDRRTPRKEDLETIAESFFPVPYNTKAHLGGGLVLRYTDAGHMLGSAFIELWWDEEKFVFTGDMGPKDAPVLCEPSVLRRADYVMIESTYGGTTRKREDWTQLGTIINETITGGGSVLIPVFAAEKLQRIIYRLGQLKSAGVLPKDLRVISDSTSGNKITDVYRKYADYFDATARSSDRPFNFPGLLEMRSQEALATHGQPGMVYLTTSAMLDHAASPRHLAAMCEDRKNTLIFVGYQSPHTLGGRIYDGERDVAIRVESPDGKVEMLSRKIKMRVEKMSGFSGHADGAQLTDWMGNFGRLKQVYVVHGEKSRAQQQAQLITERYGFPAYAPALYDVAKLDKTESATRRTEESAGTELGETQTYDKQDY